MTLSVGTPALYVEVPQMLLMNLSEVLSALGGYVSASSLPVAQLNPCVLFTVQTFG